MEAVMSGQGVGHRHARCVFQRGGCIEKSAIEEDPSFRSSHAFSVPGCHADGPPRERFEIAPGESLPVPAQFLLHDLPAGLLDGLEASRAQFSQQRRLAAT